MKPFRMHAALLLFLSCSIVLQLQAQSQQYYVVVGAFAKESNAKKFKGFVKSRFFQASYELNPVKNLFYVYVLSTTDRKDAIDQVTILQKEEAFRDSWIFVGTLGKIDPVPVVSKSEPVVTQPEVKEEPTLADTVSTKPTESPVVEIAPVSEPSKAKRVVKGKLFKFNILSPSGEPVTGNVHHVDLRRGRDLGTYTSADYSDVPKPAEEPMTLVCGIFGYKEITQLVDYQNPSQTEGTVQDEENAWVIPFQLERLKKGDVSVMYDVSFYKDAVIMLPRSQEELDELVSLMNASPDYKIKIHGHCNGNKKRKIIALGKNRNYFAMEGSSNKNGSAKELSKQRAEAVRDYLVEHGIDESRMEVMAWGGTNMLTGENSPSAKLNDRIEIEILEGGA